MSAIADYMRSLFAPTHRAIVEYEAEVDAASHIGENSWIRVGARLRGAHVGADVFVGFRSSLAECDVADGTLIASGVRVGRPREPRCHVGSGVWIGAGAEVAPGVAIADGAVVAAGSLVETDVAANTIAAGSPARQIKQRVAVEDGLPSFRELLNVVARRQRSAHLLGFALARSVGHSDVTSLMARSLIDGAEPATSNWSIGAATLIDADISGGPGVVLCDDVILIGRGKRSPGLWPSGGIYLGEATTVGRGAILEGAGGITTGPSVHMGPGVQVLSSSHDYRRSTLPLTPAPVHIGSGVSVGANAVLVGPLQVPDGEVIPPGSIVLRDSTQPDAIKIVDVRTERPAEGVVS
ncbi:MULTISPECIES: acyltransferase [Rhodococcus]|nr:MULTISPECIES: hypothetical protein [Rhodococcus]QQZ18416.1 hypothetical protein GO592_40220 [Rhodococcus sp. 21391]